MSADESKNICDALEMLEYEVRDVAADGTSDVEVPPCARKCYRVSAKKTKMMVCRTLFKNRPDLEREVRERGKKPQKRSSTSSNRQSRIAGSIISVDFSFRILGTSAVFETLFSRDGFRNFAMPGTARQVAGSGRPVAARRHNQYRTSGVDRTRLPVRTYDRSMDLSVARSGAGRRF